MAKDRYKKLFSFTIILSIGTIISKLMTYVVLTPLYTKTLSTEEFGIVELVVQTANLLMPLVSLGINQAVLRFGMDGETDRGSVLTSGLLINLAGFGIFALFYPLVRLIPAFGEYSLLIYLFIFCSITHYLFAYCVKSMQKAKLFTICVIIGTAITVLLDILFLAVWDMGIVGYILAIALSDLICSFILIFTAKLWKLIRFDKLKKPITKAMLRYSVPLIPNSALWWITDYSDRYMVTLYIGESANGLYSLAYRLPNMLIMVCGIFMDAWQMSVLSEKSRLERQKFFSNVFAMYQSIIFVGAAGLIMGAKLVTQIMIQNQDYYPSWQYIPTLVIATAMSCFVTFLGTIYVVEKKSKSSLITTVIGTIVNLAGNFILIPLMGQYGAHGAALATASSYGLVFLLRAFHTRKFIPIDWNLPRFFANFTLVIAQAVIMVFEVPGWMYMVPALFILVLVINFRLVLDSVRQVISSRKGG